MAAPSTGFALEVRRTFNARRERVFAAWTSAEEIQRWSAPGDMKVPTAVVDLKVGGKYRIVMEAPDGTQHPAYGRYEVIEPPSKLVYTWGWESGLETDTLVTVEFHERGASTEVVLKQERLTSAESREKHTQGWNGCLDKLATLY